jgi:hypothetical protein
VQAISTEVAPQRPLSATLDRVIEYETRLSTTQDAPHLGVGGRQAFFCVPAIAAIPPDIRDVGGPTHQTEARLGREIALFLMSTAKTPGPRDIFANSKRRSLEADEQVNEQVITYFYL